MKKLIMVGVCLLALIGQAHAKYERRHQHLPPIMTGSWCIEEDSEDHDSWVPTIYKRCEDKGATHVKSDVYGGGEWGCLIKTSERVTSSIFLVHAHCEGFNQAWPDDEVFQIIDGELYTRFIVAKFKSQKINELVASFYAADEECRGSARVAQSVDWEATEPCKARHKVMKALLARNYCYGKDNQSHSEMELHKCTKNSLR
jgi:hypothetical protein